MAPAGFGKSTLMADWHAALSGQGFRVGWLSLDPDDNEPLRFLAYLVGALNRADSTLGQRAGALLRSIPVSEPESLLPLIVNDLAATEARVALFLDDLHHLTHASIIGFLDRLLAYAPQNLCLYMASRSDPPLQVQRLRLAQQIVVLGVDDLRFDREEAALFLNAKRGLALPDEEVGLLHGKTEGWAAGLQLASLSLRQRRERGSFLKSFTGTDRDVADFLAHDVLLRQPQEVQDFLLATSLLPRFDAALAAVVTGRADAGEMLERIWAQNLFLVPLDGERRWFRYHHLFADFLRARLARLRPGEPERLHRTAAEACRAAGDTATALHHLLAAGEADEAAVLVERAARELIERGQLTLLGDWLARLPAAAADAHPRLHLIHTWIDFHMMEPRRGLRHLRAARRKLGIVGSGRQGPAGAVEPALLHEFRTLLTGTLSAADHNRSARDMARRWLPEIPRDQAFLRGTLANILAFSCYTLGDMREAAEAAQRGRQEHRRAGSPFGLIYADLILALVEKARGHLSAAETLLEQSRALARESQGQAGYCEAMVAVFQAELAYERGDIALAETLLQENHYIIEGTALIVHALSGHLHLARLEANHGRRQSALAILARAEALGRERLYRRLRAGVLNEEVRLLLAGGDLAAAQAALGRVGLFAERRRPPDHLPSPAVEFEQVAIARVLLAERRYDEALGRLDLLARRMEEQGRRRRLLQIQCLKAIALLRLGRDRAAEELLGRTLAEAEGHGFFRTVADEGRALRPLLIALLNRQGAGRQGLASPGYMQRLLGAFAPESLPQPAPPPAQLLEPLSPRELEIMRLLGSGCSNAALARALALSPTTVKWHLRNIYGKLGVSSRTQALLAAQQLQLVN